MASLAGAQTPAPQPTPRAPGGYPLGPDSLPQPGVPKGRLEGPVAFKSKILAGTVRRYWVYVPPQYKPEQPANVLVFQDGQRATNPEGSLRVPQALENLIHKGEIPVTIGIFVTPGHRADSYPDDLGMRNPDNRAAEYDSLTANRVADTAKAVGPRYDVKHEWGDGAHSDAHDGALLPDTLRWLWNRKP